MALQTRFDWEGYLQRTPYNSVMRDPLGTRPAVPTVFSPDGSLVYLRSLDIVCRTDDVEGLRGALTEILGNQQRAVRSMRWSCARAYFCEVDYLTVWGILYKAEALPDGYIHPEHYLTQAWSVREGDARAARL